MIGILLGGVLIFGYVWTLRVKEFFFWCGFFALVIFLIALLFFHWHVEAEGTTGFDQGQIRRSILLAMLFVFFVFLGEGPQQFQEFSRNSDSFLSHLKLIWALMFGFYFGGRGLEEGLKKWRR